jgi:hypothetical protein
MRYSELYEQEPAIDQEDAELQRKRLARLQAKQLAKLQDPAEIKAAIKNDPRYAGALMKRIKDFIRARNDADMTEFAEMVSDLIFKLEDDPDKLKKWLLDLKNPKSNYIDPKKLLPKQGSPLLQDVKSVVKDAYTLKLFNQLRDVKPTGRSDAGPYEAAVAILSTAITFTRDGDEGGGGDIYYGGRKIEVKTNSGAIYPAGKVVPDMSIVTDFLKKNKIKAPDKKGDAEGIGYTVVQFTKMMMQRDQNEFLKKFPFVNFIKAVSKAWFKRVDKNLVDAVKLMDPLKFKQAWAEANFNFYKEIAGHEGVLLITNKGNFAYYTSGDQLSDLVARKGMELRALYFDPPGDQPRRDMCKFGKNL